MSKVTHKETLTAEAFFQMPNPRDGSQQELVRGEITTMPPAGGMHGVICAKVNHKIGAYMDARPGGTLASNNTGVITRRNPDSVRGPDVAYWSKERLPVVPVGFIDVAPDLVVEVLSPSNTSKEIREKIKEYFEKGVKMVWVVAPEDRTLTIYRVPDEGRLLHDSATVTGEDILPGFTCKVSELF